MTKIVLIIFTFLTSVTIYTTYTGLGLQEVISNDTHSVRSTHSGRSSSSGWSYGK